MDAQLRDILAKSSKYSFSVIPIAGSSDKFRVVFSKPTPTQPVSDIVDTEIIVSSGDKIQVRLKHDSFSYPIPAKNIDNLVGLAFKSKQLIRNGPYSNYLQV